MTILVRDVSPTLVEVTRDDDPKACVVDRAVYAGIAPTRTEDAHWRLVKAHALTTRPRSKRKEVTW